MRLRFDPETDFLTFTLAARISKLYLRHRQNRKVRPDLQQLQNARHLLLCAARRSPLGAEKLSHCDAEPRLGPLQHGETHQW